MGREGRRQVGRRTFCGSGFCAFICDSRSDTSGTVLDEREWPEEPGECVLLKT